MQIVEYVILEALVEEQENLGLFMYRVDLWLKFAVEKRDAKENGFQLHHRQFLGNMG